MDAYVDRAPNPIRFSILKEINDYTYAPYWSSGHLRTPILLYFAQNVDNFNHCSRQNSYFEGHHLPQNHSRKYVSKYHSALIFGRITGTWNANVYFSLQTAVQCITFLPPIFKHRG